MSSRFQVFYKRKTAKSVERLPRNAKDRFYLLADDLEENGPWAKNWPNYSKLGETKYHCHLTHSWVACWQCEKDTIVIEVYYVGSRENAPY